MEYGARLLRRSLKVWGGRGVAWKPRSDTFSEIELSLSENENAELEREFVAKRAEAFQLRENLKIQREALGLRNHDRVHEFYPLPSPRSRAR